MESNERLIPQMLEKISALELRVKKLELKTRGLEPDLTGMY